MTKSLASSSVTILGMCHKLTMHSVSYPLHRFLDHVTTDIIHYEEKKVNALPLFQWI